MTVTYQVGVDVLGFPLYVEHTIYRGQSNGKYDNNKKTYWVAVQQKTFKQH